MIRLRRRVESRLVEKVLWLPNITLGVPLWKLSLAGKNLNVYIYGFVYALISIVLLGDFFFIPRLRLRNNNWWIFSLRPVQNEWDSCVVRWGEEEEDRSRKSSYPSSIRSILNQCAAESAEWIRQWYVLCDGTRASHWINACFMAI